MAPFEGPKSPLLSNVKHHYHLAITIVDVTFTKPSQFSRSGCMLLDEADIVFSILSTGTTWGFERLKLQGQQTGEGGLVAACRFGQIVTDG